MAVRYRGSAAFATQSSSIAPGHLGRSIRFINEHQPLWLKIDLGVEPSLALAEHVRPLLFGGVCGFF
jgi:hypothetical protein